jgi:hypothetical protein
MAIIIPSKNIYQIDNPKIKDNAIDKVTVGTTVVNEHNEYNTTVYRYVDNSSSLKKGFEDWNNSATVNVRLGLDAYVHYAGVAVGIRPCYASNRTVYINRIIGNSYISELLLGRNENGYANINYRVVYNHYVGTAQITVTQYAMGGDNSDFVKDVRLTYSGDFSTSDGQLPQLTIEKSVEYKHQNSENIIAKANKTIQDKTTLLNDDIITYIDDTSIQCLIKTILCGVETYYASQTGNMSQSMWGGAPETTTRDLILTGECEKYEPVEIQITFNGNTIGINLTDGTISFGSGNKPFSLDKNEILQETAKVGETSLAEHISNNILQQYQKGKETATLLCDINDYYEYDESATNNKGEKTISVENSNRMSFRCHDIVIPMVRNEDGNDIPMSRYNNGSPKQFSVISIKKIYDGATWQRLTLQELSQ